MVTVVEKYKVSEEDLIGGKDGFLIKEDGYISNGQIILPENNWLIPDGVKFKTLTDFSRENGDKIQSLGNVIQRVLDYFDFNDRSEGGFKPQESSPWWSVYRKLVDMCDDIWLLPIGSWYCYGICFGNKCDPIGFVIGASDTFFNTIIKNKRL